MKLREEIAKTISENWPYDHLVVDVEELFKKWALEIVGDRLANTKENEDFWGDTLAINNYKDIIRQRIKESTK